MSGAFLEAFIAPAQSFGVRGQLWVQRKIDSTAIKKSRVTIPPVFRGRIGASFSGMFFEGCFFVTGAFLEGCFLEGGCPRCPVGG